MNNIDKISRDSKILIESVKDTTTNNLVTAIRSNEISIVESELSKLLTILSVSIDEGYQKSLPTYQNTIRKHFKIK